jgi:hypothetical protein
VCEGEAKPLRHAIPVQAHAEQDAAVICERTHFQQGKAGRMRASLGKSPAITPPIDWAPAHGLQPWKSGSGAFAFGAYSAASRVAATRVRK